MNMTLGFVVEGAVAVLLMVTIGYCIMLNNRLKRLHSDRDALRQMVTDLVRATDMANSAIKGLRETATEADAILSSRLQEADRFAIELANHVNAGQTVMDRITRVTDTVRRTKKTSAAAAAPSVGEVKGARAALDRLSTHKQRKESAA